MSKYIKRFQEYSKYEEYITGSPLLPNVSLCKDNNKVYYKPYIPPSVSSITITALEYTPTEVDATGGTSMPTLGYIITYTDGSTTTSGGTVNYKMGATIEGVTLDETTGVITWGKNIDSETRIAAIRAEVSASGYSDSRNIEVSQRGMTVQSVVINEFSYDPSEIAATGGTSTPKLGYVITYEGGETATTGGIESYQLNSGEEITIDEDNGQVTWSKNYSASARTAQIKVTVSKGDKAIESEVTITQKGGVYVSEIIITKFSYTPLTTKAAGGTATSSVKYTIYYTDGTTASYGGTCSFEILSGEGLTFELKNEGTIRWAANTSHERTGIVMLTVSKDDVSSTKTVTVTQEGGIAVSSIQIDTFKYTPEEVSAAGGDAIPTLEYTIYYEDGTSTTTGGTVTYKGNLSTDVTLNVETGVVTWYENIRGAKLQYEVYVYVSKSGVKNGVMGISMQAAP